MGWEPIVAGHGLFMLHMTGQQPFVAVLYCHETAGPTTAQCLLWLLPKCLFSCLPYLAATARQWRAWWVWIRKSACAPSLPCFSAVSVA